MHADAQMHLRQQLTFTLLDLLVVLVIIGLPVGYVVGYVVRYRAPRHFAQVGKSEVKVARAQLQSWEDALDPYRLVVGHYPGSVVWAGGPQCPAGRRGALAGPLSAQGRAQ
jgi:general secretion pathway protein G